MVIEKLSAVDRKSFDTEAFNKPDKINTKMVISITTQKSVFS